MKKLMILPFIMALFFTTANAANPVRNTSTEVSLSDSATFKVYGNCGMCKKRIESALSDVKGIEKATWDVKSKMISVTFNPQTISLLTIKKKIAEAGHDTDETKADDKVYNKLPGCCKYERK